MPISESENQARRALFSQQHARLIRARVFNFHEPAAFLLSPPHAGLHGEMLEYLAKIGIPSDHAQCLVDAGFELFDKAVVESYEPAELFRRLTNGLGLPPTPTAFDPLYGMACWNDGYRIRNVGVVRSLWWQNVLHAPQPYSDLYWNRPEEILDGGRSAGLKYLATRFPSSVKRATRVKGTAETVATSADQFFDQVRRVIAGFAYQPHTTMWYRGQTADHLVVDRTRAISRGWAPYSNVRDSSLVPRLYRDVNRLFDDTAKYERLVDALLDWVQWCDALLDGDLRDTRAVEAVFGDQPYVGLTVMAKSAQWQIDSSGERIVLKMKKPSAADAADTRLVPVDNWQERLMQFRRGVLMQHYGCPTQFVDITSDPAVALWFALHECVAGRDGRLQFRRRHWSEGDDLPTVYVMPLTTNHTYLDSRLFLGSDVPGRVGRQSCGLLGGAGSLCRNYPARYVAFKIRLAPGFEWSEAPTQEWLFPPADEDPVLKHLLRVQTERGRSIAPVTYV